ncbi:MULTISPECIES: hypothetical protein [Sutcliffiella]|nr:MULTISPECIES: hypothetical protein [Sutcliffiella]WBL16823.1 hypothetical protein O1A01_09380 [Sutcliffiella sp. NC1]
MSNKVWELVCKTREMHLKGEDLAQLVSLEEYQSLSKEEKRAFLQFIGDMKDQLVKNWGMPWVGGEIRAAIDNQST